MTTTIYKSSIPPIEVFQGSLPELMLQSPNYKGRENLPLMTDAQSGKTLTIADHFKLVRAFTALFKQYGLQRDDVVALYVPNNIYLPAVHQGILSAGGTISPINSAYPVQDVRDQIESAGAKYAIAFDGNSMLKTVTDATAALQVRVVPFSKLVAEALSTKAGEGPAGDHLPLVKPAKDTLAYLCFSSGTTGGFKGVMTSHMNMNANIMQSILADSVIYSPNAVYSAFLPMTHIYGLNLHIYCTVYMGAQNIVMPAFDFELFLKSVVKYQMSHVYLVPPIMVLLAKSPLVDKYPEITESLKFLFSGAAPLSTTLAMAVTKRLKSRIIVCQGYGMTETSPVVTMTFHYRPDSKIGSVGQLVPNCEARLIDLETGKDAPPQGTGELLVRGPNVMMGYLNNDVANAETLIGDGWLRTGDVAHVDDDGYWYIVDRYKEMIKSKGFQVAPAELEALLLAHPHVVDAAVIGHWSEEEATEHPRAFVVLVPNGDAEQVKKWIDEQVAKHKRLWGGIVVVDQIPKSPSGKILRRFLKDRKDDIVVGVKSLVAKL
ncbi:hypothetical protein V1512DRAFT_83226 [Lipomyces arxii]|uniref:uncharacterized protein n=1 Tax=Lipomyces arxii TaxID=56418 RepID=UPI0034CD420A